jgi:hypothetical protein
MKVRCVRPHGRHRPGDVAEVPDGSEVSPLYWEPVPAAQPKPAAVPAAAPTTPKGDA